MGYLREAWSLQGLVGLTIVRQMLQFREETAAGRTMYKRSKVERII